MIWAVGTAVDPSASGEETVALPEPATAPTRDELPAPEKVGRYRVGRRLGAGGMGIVYEGHDPDLDRTVAIKLLRPSRGDPRAARRMVREAQAMAQLSHENVVAVYDVGVVELPSPEGSQTLVFIAMELVAGTTLRTWLRTDRTPPQILDAFLGAARGLAAAHAAGLVHRDFKPANAMVGDDGRIRVMDFGLARTEDNTHSGEPSAAESMSAAAASSAAIDMPLTQAGSVMGTPAYMAPEQHRGGSLDARSDQYAWCVGLWEALFGVRPFRGDTLADLTAAKRTAAPTVPSPRPDVPRWLEAALRRGLAPERGSRWPSMSDLLGHIASRRARRRTVALAGLSVMVAAAIGVGMVASPKDAGGCDPRRELGGVWDDTRREALQASFAGSEREYVRTGTAHVIGMLDARADEWVAARTRTCEIVGEQGPASAPQVDARISCLMQRRATLEATVDRLLVVEGEHLSAAVDLALRLPSASACADESSSGATVPPPTDPAIAAEVEAIRTAIAKLQVADPQEPAVHEQARTIVERARDTGYAPVLAEARLTEGDLLVLAAADDSPVAALEDAYEIGTEAGADAVAGLAASRLAFYLMFQGGDPDGALDWGQAGLAAARRVGPDAIVVARASSTLATVFMQVSRYPEAEAAFLEAIRIEERLYGPDDARLAQVRSDYSQLLLRMSRYAESREHAEFAASKTADLYGPSHPTVALSYAVLGNIMRLQRDYVAAKPTIEASNAMFAATLGPKHYRVAQGLANYANLMSDMGATGRSREIIEQSMTIFEEAFGPDHPAVAMSLDNLSASWLSDGEPDKALELAKESLEIRLRTHGETHYDVARSWDAMGHAYNDLGQAQLAAEHHLRALDVLEAAAGPSHQDYVHMCLAAADVLVEDQRFAEAIPPLERALAACREDDPRISTCHKSKLMLARALAGSGGDLVRARAVATEARDFFDRDDNSMMREAAVTWLREHPAP
jgi:tetratricopeptide (TPR) repeat protein